MPTLITLTQAGFVASASATSRAWNSVIAVPAGTTVVITVGFWGTNQSAALTFVANHITFTLVRRDTNASNTYTQAIYIGFNPVSQVNTGTWSIASGTAGPCFLSVSYGTNVDTSAPVVVSSGAFGAGLTSTSPSFSAAGGALYMAHGMSGTPAIPTTPAGATATLNGQSGGVPCFFTWAGIAAFSGTVAAQSSTWSTSGDWIAQIVGLAQQSPATHYVEPLSETVPGPGGGPIGESFSEFFVSAALPPPPLPVADVRVLWADGTIDMQIVDDDIASDPGLRTSVVLSLFTDRRAEADDALPNVDGDRRGWWGDQFSAVEGDRIGSRLWLLDRSARRGDIVRVAEEYIRESLAWMIEDKVTSRIDVKVDVAGDALLYAIGIARPQGDPVAFRFAHTWASIEERGL